MPVPRRQLPWILDAPHVLRLPPILCLVQVRVEFARNRALIETMGYAALALIVVDGTACSSGLSRPIAFREIRGADADLEDPRLVDAGDTDILEHATADFAPSCCLDDDALRAGQERPDNAGRPPEALPHPPGATSWSSRPLMMLCSRAAIRSKSAANSVGEQMSSGELGLFRERCCDLAGQEFVGAQPRAMVEDRAVDHELICPGLRDEGLQVARHGGRRADE